MLDIQCGEDIDTRFDQLLNIQMALGVSASGHVAVCQLVDDDEPGLPFEKSVDIHLLKHVALVFDLFAGDYLKPAKLFFGVLTSVRFDQAYHDIEAALAFGLRRP